MHRGLEQVLQFKRTLLQWFLIFLLDNYIFNVYAIILWDIFIFFFFSDFQFVQKVEFSFFVASAETATRHCD